MFHIISHQDNANENYFELSADTYLECQKKKKIVKTPNAGMDGGKLDNSHLPSRYVK